MLLPACFPSKATAEDRFSSSYANRSLPQMLFASPHSGNCPTTEPADSRNENPKDNNTNSYAKKAADTSNKIRSDTQDVKAGTMPCHAKEKE